jgi:hypothetical protein
VVLLRLFWAPRRWREHVVTICWAAGLAVQVPVYLYGKAKHLNRHIVGHGLGYALYGYAVRVVQRVPGMVFPSDLNKVIGVPAASAIIGVLEAAAADPRAAPAPRARRTRARIAVAVLACFLVAMWGTGYRHTRAWPGRNPDWAAFVQQWQAECHDSTTGSLHLRALTAGTRADTIPCSKIVG